MSTNTNLTAFFTILLATVAAPLNSTAQDIESRIAIVIAEKDTGGVIGKTLDVSSVTTTNTGVSVASDGKKSKGWTLNDGTDLVTVELSVPENAEVTNIQCTIFPGGAPRHELSAVFEGGQVSESDETTVDGRTSISYRSDKPEFRAARRFSFTAKPKSTSYSFNLERIQIDYSVPPRGVFFDPDAPSNAIINLLQPRDEIIASGKVPILVRWSVDAARFGPGDQIRLIYTLAGAEDPKWHLLDPEYRSVPFNNYRDPGYGIVTWDLSKLEWADDKRSIRISARPQTTSDDILDKLLDLRFPSAQPPSSAPIERCKELVLVGKSIDSDKDFRTRLVAVIAHLTSGSNLDQSQIDLLKELKTDDDVSLGDDELLINFARSISSPKEPEIDIRRELNDASARRR